MTAYAAPVPLTRRHRAGDFVCASIEQTDWLRHHARQAQSTGTIRVFVVTATGTDVVVACYAWCMAQIELTDAPSRPAKDAGRYPQPVALLARLGVHVDDEGQGSGPGCSLTSSPAPACSPTTSAAEASSSTPRTTTREASTST